jgi:hypothetical protein
MCDTIFPRGNGGYRLLTPGNPKTTKGESQGYWTFILHLAPAKLSGYNVCPMADSCVFACLNTAGRGGMAKGVSRLTYSMVKRGKRNDIQRARIRKTRAYFEHRDAFMQHLVADITRAIRIARAAGFVPVFRLNGTSDIRWESVPVNGAPNVMALFPDVQFYDYTKIPNRKRLPANYHITFSLSQNEPAAQAALVAGMNVAAVFRDKATVQRYIASGYMGAPVYCGDDSDLRFLDPRGHVIALYAKGNAKRDRTGFVRD